MILFKAKINIFGVLQMEKLLLKVLTKEHFHLFQMKFQKT